MLPWLRECPPSSFFHLLPVIEEFLQSAFRKRMYGKFFKKIVRNSTNMSACFGGINYMPGVPRGSHENLSGEMKISPHIHNFPDEPHTVLTCIIEAADERTDDRRTGFRGKNRLIH